MNRMLSRLAWIAAVPLVVALPHPTWADTDTATKPPRVIQQTLTPHWSDNDSFWFRKQNADGDSVTIRVDAVTGEMTEVATGENAGEEARLSTGAVPRSGRSTDMPSEITLVNSTEQTLQMFWVTRDAKRVAYASVEPGEDYLQTTYAGHVWEIIGKDKTNYGHITVGVEPMRLNVEAPATKKDDAKKDDAKKTDQKETEQPKRSRRSLRSPGNGNWTTGVESPTDPNTIGRLKDGKLQLRIGKDAEWKTLLTNEQAAKQFAGKNQHQEATVTVEYPQWTPDGKVLCASVQFDIQPKTVSLIESSPKEAGRAKLTQRYYDLPGDPMDEFAYIAFNSVTGEAVPLDLPIVTNNFLRVLWGGPHRLLLEVVDRGHQRFRLFAIDMLTGETNTVIDEKSDTFVWTAHKTDLARWTYIPLSDEVIWVSEKDGYQHLYLVDLAGVRPITPITQGDLVVRAIDHIDQDNRTIDLVVSGVYDDQDPYLKHYARVDFSGQNFTLLTDGNGNHTAKFSPDRSKLVVTHSRVDSLPVHELRDCDGKLITRLAEATITPDDATWNWPVVFDAKGRDGETDIWGIAYFPVDYDPSATQKYPVIEYIYAGPHDSHVPKSFQSGTRFQSYLDAGFIVVQIDGMGTANRSKKFHDVCWQNLKDAGFPDRIAWMKALAAEHPAMDLDRVGIFGTSAGGQNTGSALLFHGDFYDAGVAACGCHDNRMDKASWNEQWMGYPVGEHYSASSNIDHAKNLKGDLFLIVGELDTNVPPESTLRFADALIKANKDFDMLVMPGVGHSDGGRYGKRRTLDFFIEKLQPGEPKGSAETQSIGQTDFNPSEFDPAPAIDVDQIAPQTGWLDISNHFYVDLETLKRRLPVRVSEQRLTQLQSFLDAWQRHVRDAMQADGDAKLTESELVSANKVLGQIDLARAELRTDVVVAKRIMELAPFANQLIDTTDLSNRDKTLHGAPMAKIVQELSESIDATIAEKKPGSIKVSQLVRDAASELRTEFYQWRIFYEEYNPQYDWWVKDLAADADRKLMKWLATMKVEDTESGKLAKAVANGEARLPEPTKQSMFDADYPPLGVWSDREPTHMPGVFDQYAKNARQRYRSKRQGKSNIPLANVPPATLENWRDELAVLQLDGKPFDEWPIDDQVDWHLLSAEIETQIGRDAIEATGEKMAPATSSVESDLSGVPVGRERIELELRRQFIEDSPEQLIELAEREYAIVRAEMLRVAQDMGLGDDWKAAVDRMKNQHVQPGEQPQMIGTMARESVQWLRKRDWITVPSFAENCWRMEMMTPERQKVNPFFTGGEVISVSFPTSSMSISDKRQSLRGNNIGYARAVVHHELIPGHHLQMYMNQRYQPHRRTMGTPFWLEGLAVYWELKLYDDGFARTPEERMGMLVWRAHRCARIIFSLNFHLGRFSPDQCVDFLVDNVGFERRNATAEVRRSIGVSYPPLYQAAYMLGALQFRQLHRELVLSGTMGECEFHDAVMEAGNLPIALLRPILTKEALSKDGPPMWRFE